MASEKRVRVISDTAVRLYQDQAEWLEEMRATRAAEPATLVRVAVDYYRPVYEATSQGLDPELQAAVGEAARIVGTDKVLAALRDLLRAELTEAPSRNSEGGGA